MAKPKRDRYGESNAKSPKTDIRFTRPLNQVDYNQGSGYFHANTPRMQKLFKKWETRLLESGFVDIEYRDTLTGLVSPLFRVGQSSVSTKASYQSQADRYYQLARQFEQHFDFKIFGGKVTLYKYLFHLHANGVSNRQAMHYVAGGYPLKNHSDVMRLAKYWRRNVSVYWVHSHTAKILVHFHNWLKTNHGFDATNTLKRENAQKARAMRKSPPAKNMPPQPSQSDALKNKP